MKQEEIALQQLQLVGEEAIRELGELNEELKETGMFLKEDGVRDLLLARQETLSRHGRLEWSLSMLCRILTMAAESPYIEKDDLQIATEQFFETITYIQNETSDFLPDDDILRAVFLYYNHFCAGDRELLRGSATDRIIKNFRLGRDLETGYDNIVGISDTFDDREPENQNESELRADDGLSSDIFIAKSFVVRSERSSGIAPTDANALAAPRTRKEEADEQMHLLRAELIHYVGSDASSVAEKTALNISNSIQYTISLGGDKGSVWTRFHLGQLRLKELYSESAAMYKELLTLSLMLPLDTFYGTVYREIRQFFRLYDPQYAAHECPSLMDYPTAIEVDEAPGILYMCTYLRRLLFESKVIARIPISLRMRILSAYERKYDMIVTSFPINFFEIMMNQAFASALVLDTMGLDTQVLWTFEEERGDDSVWILPPEAYEPSLSFLSAMSISERKVKIERISTAVIASLGTLSAQDEQYLQEIAERWVVLFESALMNECPQNTILFSSSTPLMPVNIPEYFAEGEQMSDEAYADLLEKLACAPDTSVQATLIRDTVRSGHDLLDLLREDFWLPGEKEAFLSSISEEERELLKRMDDPNEPVLGKDT